MPEAALWQYTCYWFTRWAEDLPLAKSLWRPLPLGAPASMVCDVNVTATYATAPLLLFRYLILGDVNGWRPGVVFNNTLLERDTLTAFDLTCQDNLHAAAGLDSLLPQDSPCTCLAVLNR